MKPNILVVGAGAVGQVYARHLQLAGAHVTLFVRDKYRDAIARGFDMYPLNRWRRGEPVRVEGFDVMTRADEVAQRKFAQVYLTVSSPALEGPWLPELIAAVGDATIVSLQPGHGDRDAIIAAGASPAHLVSGMISLISYPAPLPGETRFPRPGMAYWFPPLQPSPFSGPIARTTVAIELLRFGGLPAKHRADVPKAVAFPSAVMMVYLTALEAAGWSFAALMRDGMGLAVRGVREVLAIVALTSGKAPFGVRMLARPRILRFGLWLARRVVPLPLEVYLREHFTKVGDQTRLFMRGYIERGKAGGLDVTALEQLTAALPAAQRAAS